MGQSCLALARAGRASARAICTLVRVLCYIQHHHESRRPHAQYVSSWYGITIAHEIWHIGGRQGESGRLGIHAIHLLNHRDMSGACITDAVQPKYVRSYRLKATVASNILCTLIKKTSSTHRACNLWSRCTNGLSISKVTILNRISIETLCMAQPGLMVHYQYGLEHRYHAACP